MAIAITESNGSNDTNDSSGGTTTMNAATVTLLRSGRRFLPPTWVLPLFAAGLISSSGCGGRDGSAPNTNTRVGDDAGLADSTRPSDADAAPAVDASPDVPEDHSVPIMDATGCARPVWQPTDVGFTYSSSGGFAPTLDAGCGPFGVKYDFALVGGEATLTEHACAYDGPVNDTVSLTAEQLTQVTTALSNLYTVCPHAGCGADAPTITLTIGSTTYNSDFYAGCGGMQDAPPYIAFDALGPFEQQLDTIVRAACAADAGTDAGACTQAPADGG
jgi:hypothetical protein